jgi:hypothetical protein
MTGFITADALTVLLQVVLIDLVLAARLQTFTALSRFSVRV